MRCVIQLFLSVIASVSFSAQKDQAMKDAIRNGAIAKICYRVVDDEGEPVSNAVAHVWFSSYSRHQDDANWKVLTDANGMFTVEHRTNESLDCGFDKDGYYHSSDQILFRERKDVCPKVVDGKWQPYGETRTVVLKRIKKPIPIQVPGRCSAPIPAYDQWIGFDLEKKQWISPYGNGQYADVLMKFSRFVANPQTDFRLTLEVSFTNNPHAGFYQMKKDKFSESRFEHQADSSANFRTEARYIHARHPNSPRIDDRLDMDSYLIFRTRTTVDEHGSLVSAHYGIINGKWSFFDSLLSEGYLFNPTPNDTNLEDVETYRKSLLRRKQNLEFERRRKAKGK